MADQEEEVEGFSMEAYEEEAEKNEPLQEEHEEVVVHADEGDMLELKPLLNIQRERATPTLRPNYFTPNGASKECVVHSKHGGLETTS